MSTPEGDEAIKRTDAFLFRLCSRVCFSSYLHVVCSCIYYVSCEFVCLLAVNITSIHCFEDFFL